MSGLLLHSVSYAGLWGQASLSLESFIDKAADLGYDGVMLMAKRPHLSVLDYDGSRRLEVRRHLDKRKLTQICLAGYCNLTGDMEHAEVPYREINVTYIVQLASLARDLGASLVRVFTGYENPAVPYNQQCRLIVETLREASKRCADLGVTVGVQNHHDVAASFESFYDLLAEVAEPNCKALFDAWAPALHGHNLDEAAAKLAPITVHTTVADYQKRPRFHYNPSLINYELQTPYIQAVPMGEGFIDYRSFFATLRQSGFGGTIAYEMCSPILGGGSVENLDRYASRFLEYMSGQAPVNAQHA